MWWGTIAGVAIGGWISYSFILPNDILDLRLAFITIGDIFRMIGSFILIIIAANIGHLIDVGMGNAE